MNGDNFERFWSKVICPSIELCLEEIDDESKKYIGLTESDKIQYKSELEKLYQRKREWLKKEYLPLEGAEASLDFHKLGAIMCRCIIGNKYFKFSEHKANKLFLNITNSHVSQKEKLQKEINSIYINYKLALYVSMGISYIDLLAKVTNKEKKANSDERNVYSLFRKYLLEHCSLFEYIESDRHDDLVSSLIVTLMKNDLLKRDFDYLAYSASMYQLQEYTKDEIFFAILSLNEIKLSPQALKILIATI